MKQHNQTPAEFLRELGVGVGDLLYGGPIYNYFRTNRVEIERAKIIRITAIGESRVLARTLSEDGTLWGSETSHEFSSRQWEKQLTPPDDTEANEAIADAADLHNALFDIAAKYNVPVTNNEPRWQDGVYLRHIGSFIEDLETAFEKFKEKKN